MLAVCLVCLFSAQAQTVNETESSVILNEMTADVSIVLENQNKTFDGRIELELLDAENKIRAQAAQNVRIRNGKEIYKLTMPLGDLLQTLEDEIAWFRLHYKIADKEGFISLSELLKDIFELRVAAAENIFSGTNYRVRLRALQPFTKTPVKNVKIEGFVKVGIDTESDAGELKLKAKAETDGEGFAVLDFVIPQNMKLDDGDLTVTGRKNGVVREIEEDLETDEARGSVFLTIDKPLYQPGQSFNARGLYFDANNTVVSSSEFEF